MGDINLQHQQALVSVLQLCGLTPEGASRIGMILCGDQSGPNMVRPGILSNHQQDRLLGQLAAEAAKGGQGNFSPQAGKMLATALSMAVRTGLYRPALKDSWYFGGLIRIIAALCGELANKQAPAPSG
jgi:hypothetical protein